MLGALQGRGGSCGEKDAGKTESIPMTNRLKSRGFRFNGIHLSSFEPETELTVLRPQEAAGSSFSSVQ